MAIPANLTQVTLNGHYVGPDGSAATGTVELALSAAGIDPGGPAIVTPVNVSVTLAAGAFSVALPATDDPDWGTSGLLYHVTEKITGAPWRDYYVALPSASAPTVDLATLAPTVAAPPLAAYVLASAVGHIGGPAGPLDSSTLLPVAQLPSVPANLLPPPDLDANVAPAGCWYATPNQGSIGTTGALAAGTAYLTALRLSRAATLSGLAIEITATDTGVARLGLASEVNGQPGVWLADFGTVVVTSTGLVQLAPLAWALAAAPAGDAWLAVIPQGGTGTLTLRARTGADPSIPLTIASNATCGPLNSARTAYTSTGWAGALPIGNAVTLAGVTLGPCLGVRLS